MSFDNKKGSHIDESMQRRNRDIVRMRRSGIPRGHVARRFRLSRLRIALIEQQAEKAEAVARKNIRCLAKIRAADDLDRLWPAIDLIDLILPTAETNSLLRIYFMSAAKNEKMSLRNVMDFTISNKVDPRPGYLITPLIAARNIGRRKFRSVVARLSALDLGRHCNAEWKRRRIRLTHATRIWGGVRYSWSKPAHSDA